jgi:hypothetical protein
LYVPYLFLLAFLLHFRIFAAQPLTSDPDLDLPCNTSFLYPSSLLVFHTPCCTQDQLIYSSHFIFFSFASLVAVGLKVLCFFFFSCTDVSICPLLFVASCCFNSIVCYSCILEIVASY